jgi:succinate-semialdehyde dehydrogenase/glutarate-semialdehyde dehydrogenase
MGQSGLGRRHGAEGIRKYTETQTIAAQHVVPFAPFWGLDERGFAGVVTGAFRVFKRIGLK